MSMTTDKKAPLTTLSDIYRERFDEKLLRHKNRVWQLICKDYLQKFISPSDAVLDLGASTCEFINNIACAKKYAVDLNPDTERFAAPGVQVMRPQENDISLDLPEGCMNVVFASNFFEHLPSRQHIIDMLTEIRRILAPGGRLIIVQPNIKYLYTHYWDYFDHQIALSDQSMREAIITTGFDIEILKAKFLPYTFRSRIPKFNFLVRLYLRVPIFHALFGKQMFILARKA